MRFILNIIKGIKAACGEDFPLIVRLTSTNVTSASVSPARATRSKRALKLRVASKRRASTR